MARLLFCADSVHLRPPPLHTPLYLAAIGFLPAEEWSVCIRQSDWLLHAIARNKGRQLVKGPQTASFLLEVKFLLWQRRRTNRRLPFLVYKVPMTDFDCSAWPMRWVHLLIQIRYLTGGITVKQIIFAPQETLYRQDLEEGSLL
jgi:hypothetical protein